MCRFTTGRVFAFGALLFLLATHPAKGQLVEEWTWKDVDGKSRSRAELESIVRKHKRWMESNRKLGSRADLHGADLRDAELTEWDLESARSGRRRPEPRETPRREPRRRAFRLREVKRSGPGRREAESHEPYQR
jgi:hypothetical protein